jgi:hypothetical protein
MKTKPGTIAIEHESFEALRPNLCPYCGSEYEVPYGNIVGFQDKTIQNVVLVTFPTLCCREPFWGIYKTSTNGTAELLITYPEYAPAKLPDAIHEISPRFVRLYERCSIAEQQGAIELAGSGYRNAIEVLVKDFAIKELKEPEGEVSSKQLGKAIAEYLPNIKLQKSADVVRILGNDYTHYTTLYKDVSFQAFKRYIHIFITSIEAEYLTNHPVTDCHSDSR